MYDNNYPNTNSESQDGNSTPQNQSQNSYGGQSAGGYYRNGYQNGAYTQNRTASPNPYENRAGYYQGAGSVNGGNRINSANNTGSANNTNTAGSYHYGNTYPNDFVQSTQPNGHTDKKKQANKSSGGYLKKTLVSVSLGLFFGAFAGLGLYGVETVTGMLDKSGAQEDALQSEETMSDQVASQDGEELDAAKAELHLTESVTDTLVDVSEVAKEVMPAIVSINNHYTEKMSYFGQSIINEADASGSGIIVGQNDSELLIATNYHVIADAEKLTIQFTEGSEAEASVKGADAKMDLAVIAVSVSDIDQSTLQQIAVATLGDSDSLEVGEPAIAIGNSLGYGQSVTTGVISALNRTIDLSDGSSGTFIQTDAAINPGNSGGALLNMKGEVIGINSNKIGGSAVEGMGYAIPISAASPIIAEMMLRETKNKVAEDERGYLGISGISVTEYVSEAYGMPEGVYISQVYENTAASEAGLRKGDIITEFDGMAIDSMDKLQRELEFYAMGDTVEITIMSAGMNGYVERTVQITLGNKVTE